MTTAKCGPGRDLGGRFDPVQGHLTRRNGGLRNSWKPTRHYDVNQTQTGRKKNRSPYYSKLLLCVNLSYSKNGERNRMESFQAFERFSPKNPGS